jgi:CheY-like chemotaxis protein
MLNASLNLPNEFHAVYAAQVLLVDADTELRDSRSLLLSSRKLAVCSVGSYAEVIQLPETSCYNLVVLNMRPSEVQTSHVAEYVRRHWPKTKILLLGESCGCLDDPLYDDIVNAYCNPSGLIEAAENLLKPLRTDVILR